jgi:hypothetical protein
MAFIAIAVTRRTLTEIADLFQYWLKNRTEKWAFPFGMPGPESTGAGSHAGCHWRPGKRWPHLGPDVRAQVSQLPGFRLPQQDLDLPNPLHAVVIIAIGFFFGFFRAAKRSRSGLRHHLRHQ